MAGSAGKIGVVAPREIAGEIAADEQGDLEPQQRGCVVAG
jgi:hypothetical protein